MAFKISCTILETVSLGKYHTNEYTILNSKRGFTDEIRLLISCPLLILSWPEDRYIVLVYPDPNIIASSIKSRRGRQNEKDFACHCWFEDGGGHIRKRIEKIELKEAPWQIANKEAWTSTAARYCILPKTEMMLEADPSPEPPYKSPVNTLISVLWDLSLCSCPQQRIQLFFDQTSELWAIHGYCFKSPCFT